MFKNIYLFICGCAGSLFQCGLLPGCGEQGYPLLAVCRLLLLQSVGSGLHLVSVIAACGLSSWGAGLQGTGSLLAVLGFTCPAPSAPCGIFPDQGSTRGLLHWPSGSSLLSPWGSPLLRFFTADRCSSLPGTDRNRACRCNFSGFSSAVS